MLIRALSSRTTASHGLLLVGGGRLWLLFAGLAAASVAILASLAPSGPVVHIDSSAVEIAQPLEPEHSLRFAVAAVLAPERTAEAYWRLSGWLAERLDRPVRVVQRRTYGEINDLLEGGKVDMALICTGAYLLGVAAGLDVEPLVVPLPPTGPSYYSLTVVRRDSGHRRFEDAAAGRMAFADPLSLSGHIYPLALALQRDLEPRAVLGHALHTYSHDNSIHAVADGIVDGAAVDSLVWDYEVLHDPEIVRNLRIVHRSPSLAIQPIVVPRSLDPALRDQIRAALLSLDESTEGRRILDGLGLISFELPAPDLYDDTQALIAPLLQHMARDR